MFPVYNTGMLNLPLVSVIVVIWNSEMHLSRCLSMLSRQTFQDFEIVVVDNGSTDNSVGGLSIDDFEIPLTIKLLDSNFGFAVANNLGVHLARGKWIALLNVDAFPEPDWLEQLLLAAQQNPEYTFFSSRQIQYNQSELLDGAGDTYHVSGLAWRQYYNQPVSEFGLHSKEVFSACAAAALYFREDFIKVGGFDEDYFAYFEDVDLSFRLRLMKGRCLYVPQAVVYHVGSASTGKASDFSFYHGHRNLVWTYFKDMPSLLFWFYLPLHMLINLYLSMSFLIKENKSVVLRSKLDAFRLLPVMLRKRRIVQRTRIVDVREIYRVMNKNLFSPYFASRGRRKNDK